MKNQDTLYWLWLAEKCGIASKQFGNLIEKYENPFDIYRLEDTEIQQLGNITDSLRDRLAQKNLDASYERLKFCNQHGIDIITYGDRRYPERLKNIQDPPVVLYCKGFFPDFNASLCIGIVGTRRMSEYGRQSAYKISYDLACAKVLSVSGMALGIDGVSACGALSAGGRTVAVLGCGIDTAYPKQHARLMDAIAKHGAVITEYPPKEEPRSYNFPKRNRIISGLCHGVFVVEAAPQSGALITAKDAMGQGRDVFALPGKISDANSDGPNELIKNGAYTALSARDIIKKYEFLYGDYVNTDSLEESQKSLPSIDDTLKKYGLEYAVGDGTAQPEERLFVAKGGKKKSAPTVRQTAKKVKESRAETPKRDESAAIVATLLPKTKLVYDNIPEDNAVSSEQVAKATGLATPELMTSLTMLELQGLIMSLPGGLYKKR